MISLMQKSVFKEKDISGFFQQKSLKVPLMTNRNYIVIHALIYYLPSLI